MADFVQDVTFEIYSLNDLLTSEEQSSLRADASDALIADAEPRPGEREYKIGVVIDGWHARHHLRSGPYEVAEADDVVAWLDELANWLIPNTDPDTAVTMDIQAWDAELDNASENTAKFKALEESRKQKFLRNRSNNLTGRKTSIAQVVWHFYKLLVSNDQSLPRQSGIDARIATAMLRIAVNKSDRLILVTRDADFVETVKLINEFFPDLAVCILTLGADPPIDKAYGECRCSMYRGDWRRNEPPQLEVRLVKPEKQSFCKALSS